MRQKESSKQNFGFFKNRIIIILIIALVSVAVVLPTVVHTIHRIEARHVLRSAKDVQLTIRLLFTEYYGEGKKLLDGTKESGLSEAAEADIRKYSKCEGDLYLLSWNEEDGCFQHMIYVENGYAVDVSYQGNRQYVRNVYRLDGQIVNK